MILLLAACVFVFISVRFTSHNLPAAFRKSEKQLALDRLYSAPPLPFNGFTDHPEHRSLHGPLTFEEVGARFKQRLDQLETGCRLFGNSSMFRRLANGKARKLIIGPYWPAMKTTVEYCFIQKAASATWKEVFKEVNKGMGRKGFMPATRRPDKVNTGKLTTLGTSEKVGSGAVRQIRFLFVREPYGRLLSAYVDKLFGPNTVFWKALGTYIVRKFRGSANSSSTSSNHCGHDVTFPEFVKYVIHAQQTGQHRDGHFIPQHDHCQMCQVPYDYIGHVETLAGDMNYILNVSQVPARHITDYYLDTIRDNARWVLNWMIQDILKCMSREEATRRLWKKLQIRGIISKAESYPFTPEQADTVTLNQFVKVAQEAAARSAASLSEVKRQKKEALREAFASVSVEDRKKVKELLFLDFALFGFHPDLPFNFSQGAADTDNGFQYFRWKGTR